MNVDLKTHITPDLGIDTIVLPDLSKRWDYRFAQFISNAVNPVPVTIMILLVLAEMTHAWKWAGVYILGAVALPTLYILWLLHRGVVSDFHIRDREERSNPMIFTVFTTFLSWLGLKLGGAPIQLTAFAFIGIFLTALLLLITAFWKISIHTTAISALSVFLIALFGWQASFALLMVPLVGWARWRLKAHTLAQIVVGAVVGFCGHWLALLAQTAN